jgi:hypothetical protein
VAAIETTDLEEVSIDSFQIAVFTV